MKAEEERKCIVSGAVMAKEELLRFTVTPDNRVIPDFKKKLPGKGIWVKNSKQVLTTAVAKNLFSKAYKKNVKADAGLVEVVEELLSKRGLDSISLARKAGVLLTGLDKVSEAIKKGKVAFVLEAKDAGSDGYNRIALLAKELEIFRTYNVEELDKALDKVNTVHVAFLKSPMAKSVYNEFSRFESFVNS